MSPEQSLHAIVLAIVQGITEFLPVSSSGHLVLVPWALGWEDFGFGFDIALHVGTLVAVLVYFRREWVDLVKGLGSLLRFKSRNVDDSGGRKLALLVILGTIPAVIAGIAGKSAVEGVFRNPLIIGILLILNGLLLLVAERTGRRILDILRLHWPDALIVGCAQILGLLPGISRSGVTIGAGLARNMRREASARFSFLLAAPLILGSGLLESLDLIRGRETVDIPWALFLVGALVSGVTAALCIAWLLRFLRRGTLLPFIVYCLALGVTVVAVRLVTS